MIIQPKELATRSINRRRGPMSFWACTISCPKRQSSTGRANGYVPPVRLPGHRALPQHPIITYYG